jgi:two-component system, chemotaxis family, chemotaxis protein CheY
MASVTNAQVIQRLSILIADSRPYSRLLTRTMLSQLDIRKIHEAGEGKAAIDAILNLRPDVVILDWDISGPGAQQVLRQARDPKQVHNPELPIIVLSSSGRIADVQEAIDLGASQYMIRPVSPKMIEQRLLGIVADARRQALRQKQPARD